VTEQTRLKCAQCDKDAVSDNPQLCSHHALVLYAMLGSNILNEARTVHVCPYGDWSVLHNGGDLVGLEEVIKDHLDTDHPGWTMEEAERLMAEFDHASHDKATATGEN
jgi:hypothetical protein